MRKNVIEEDEDEDLEEEKKPILLIRNMKKKENLPIIESKDSKPNIVNTQKQSQYISLNQSR